MKTSIKTIDIQAKEWFHKSAGNSYFSAIVTVNYGLEDEQTIKLPFQYGYEEHYIDEANKALQDAGIINSDDRTALWRYCDLNGITLRTSKQEDCKQSEVKSFVA